MIFSKQLCGYIQVIEAQIYSQAWGSGLLGLQLVF